MLILHILIHFFIHSTEQYTYIFAVIDFKDMNRLKKVLYSYCPQNCLKYWIIHFTFLYYQQYTVKLMNKIQKIRKNIYLRMPKL